MTEAPYILPVENQVRELDAKLLLACFAADRGHPSYLGWKSAINGELHKAPTGVYFSKSLTSRAVKMLKVSKRLGHKVVAWDEEAVVHYPPDVYYSRRMSAGALQLTDLLLTWGEDNKALFEGFPGATDLPLQVVGNPRADLLRPEFRPFFDARVQEIRQQFGDFILINTNFGTINGFYPGMNVCYPDENAPEGLALGRGANGFSREFAVRLYKYRIQVLDKIKRMVPELARAFPGTTIVLRPHPAENRDFWHEHLEGIDNVHVEATGNVVPWLLACSALIHNGCTTAVEGYILEKPVIAYVPVPSGEEFAIDPPNSVSDVATTMDVLVEKVGAVLAGKGPCVNDDRRSALLAQFIASLDGEFAAQRIVHHVDRHVQPKPPPAHRRVVGTAAARARQFATTVKSVRNTGRFSAGFKQQRFPDVTIERMRDNVGALAALGGLTRTPNIRQIGQDLFYITSG